MFEPWPRTLALSLSLACASTLAVAEQRLIRFDLPAASLAQTLNAIARQSGQVVSLDPALVQGKQAPAISGEMTAEQALQQALQGSGLELRSTQSGTYSVQSKANGDGALELGTTTINGNGLGAVTEGTGSLTTAGPVTAATGLNLSLRETPQSVTVITRERMEQQNLNSLAEVAEQVPGVHFNSTGTPIGGRTWMYSRGFIVNSYQVDGVNLPWETMSESSQYGHGALDTSIYDSVTVVRGSTGLMTGAGEPSALMALTRKKPTSELQTTLEATTGSWDHYRGMADVGGPLNESGTLRARVVGAYDEGDTWVDRYSNERSILYGVIEADLSLDTLLTVTLEHGTADSKGAPWAADYGAFFYFADGETPIPHDESTSIVPDWTDLNSDRSYLTTTLAHQFSEDWKGRLSYGYGKFNSKMHRGMISWLIPEDGSPTVGRVLSLDYSYDTHIVDAQLDGKYQLFGREHELVTGFNFYRNDQSADTAYLSNAYSDFATWNNGGLHFNEPNWNDLDGSEDDYPYDSKIEQEGAFVATRLHPTDRLSVILGGRMTTWKSHSKDRATAYHDAYVWDDRVYSSELTPYAGVVLDLTQNLSAYVSYTQIFNPQDVKDADGRLLDPEEGDTYEVGLKGAWFDDRLNTSIAVFESKRDNLAVEDGINVTPDGDQAYRAESDTQGKGWEFEVAGELTPRWQVQAGYTYFRNEDHDGNVLDATQPEQLFKLYTSYQPALLPKLTLGTSVRWQDDTHVAGESDPLYDIDSYFVVGANADYQLTEELSLSLLVNNVLDEEYRVSNYSYSYGAPLNASVSVRAQF